MCGGEENTSPASSMGKTVKNLLLICTTTDLSMLGTTAGISLVRSHHKLCERGNQRGVPKAGRKQGGCEECWYSEDVAGIQRSPEWRGGLHLGISKLWFLWGLNVLVSGSFCWVISISRNKTGFCLSLVFFIILSLIMQGNTVVKNTGFEGKILEKRKKKSCTLLLCAI